MGDSPDRLKVKGDRNWDDEEEWEMSDERRHNSSKSKKRTSEKETERRSSKDRGDSKKRSGGSGSIKADSDDEDYDLRQDLRSKQGKRKHDESALEKLSSWYQDGELHNRQDGDNSGSRGHARLSDESDQRKNTLKGGPEHERSRRKEEKKEENTSDKGENARNSRRRWDEPDSKRKSDESYYEASDSKYESDRVRISKNETIESEKGLNSDNRDNRRSPIERTGRRHEESDQFDTDYEKSSDFKKRELDKDDVRDDRSKGNRDEGWKDAEGSREHWRRNKDLKDGDTGYDRGNDWELSRRSRDRNENDNRLLGRPVNRREGNRGEAVKTSSNFGISNENYDVIEIQTKPLHHGRPTTSQPSNEDLPDKYMDEGASNKGDSNTWRDETDYRGVKGGRPGQNSGGQSLQLPFGHRSGRGGGRGSRPSGRDNNLQVGPPLPMMAPHFAPLGMPPPGAMTPLTPGMSPAPGPPISPSVLVPPFSPVVWSGARGVDMNMFNMQIPPGPVGPRFPPNMVNSPNPGMFFNQPGPGRDGPPNITGPGLNAGTIPDRIPGGWVPRIGPAGKAPSRGEQNDYSQNFVDTGMRPQNFIRELELTNVVEDYPKLRELIQKKDEIVANSASAPMYYKCDLKEFELSPEFFGTKFDVILVDPPWEEYVHRAPGVTDHMQSWTFEEILNLKIEAIADTPSFIFLWVGDGVGLEQGRQCLKKWGFRRCEDICWVKTNKNTATPGLRHDSHTLFQHSKEHCLMGIKGTVRRTTDGHVIHANIDTDVIIAEEPPYGSTQKPEDMYRIIEHFSLGRRRLELFGEEHNIRSGWLTVGKGLSSSSFDAKAYVRNFADKDGKVWQGGGGRNPPPEAPHLVVTTPEIEALRPKSPMRNQQQMQEQSTSISLTSGSSNKRPAINSLQNPDALGFNQEASGSTMSTPAPWSMDGGLRGREGSIVMGSEERGFDMHMYGGGQQPNGDFQDFEARRAMNML
ncbi:hypothetical protein ACFE04_010493 [Oxalis oulophora]